MKQIIAFKRGYFCADLKQPILKPSEERLRELVTLSMELMEYGVLLDNGCISRLSQKNMEEIHTEVLPYLHDLYHKAGEEFAPLYPGFPMQVISKPEEDIWKEQHQIYETEDYDEFLRNNRWYTDKEQRPRRHKDMEFYEAINEEEFLEIPQKIMAAGNSLTEETREELCWFLDEYRDLKIPERIPFKETLCIVMSKRRDVKPSNINDILRLALYMMGGDPSLKHGTRKDLTTLKRSSRREILERLEEMDKLSCVDATKFYGSWVLLNEHLHCGDYKERYPKTFQFFTTLQGKKQGKTWYSKLQDLYDSGSSVLEIAKFLSQRPGEFIRRFDSLQRRAEKDGEDVGEIYSVLLETEGMKNKTLFELLRYYDKRGTEMFRCQPNRTSKKDNRKHRNILLESLPAIDEERLGLIETILREKILKNVFDRAKSNQDMLDKKVYIDPTLRYIPVPTDMRERTVALPVGTKFEIPAEHNIIRLFTHWIDTDASEDLDLHVFFASGDLKKHDRIGYDTLHHKKRFVVHSGDVRHRVGKCAEYVDIDIISAVLEGYRYALVDVCNYSERTLDSVQAWLGYTYRQEMEKGGSLTWNPSQIDWMQKIITKSNNVCSWMIDLVERKMIFLDMPFSDFSRIPTDEDQLGILRAAKTENSFTSYDIVVNNFAARGAVICDSPDEPDTEFISAKEYAKDYTKLLAMMGE